MVSLRRRDPARRMARAYGLALQSVLGGGWDLVREWGRIGSAGRVRCDPFADEAEALVAAARLEQLKRRRGYR